MKAIVCADLHIHPFRDCSRDGGADRLRDGLSALRQALQAAREHRCPFVFLGDLKHVRDRWLLSVLNGVRAAFAEYADVPKLLVAGNHDGLAGGASGLAVFRSHAEDRVVCAVQDEPGFVPWAMLDGGSEGLVAVWPWQPVLDGLPAFVEEARGAGARVLLAHAFLQGAALGPDDVRLGIGASLEAFGLAGKDRVFDYAFFGDVHKQQTLGGGRDEAVIWYPGSVLATNWGERGENGCLYVEIN